MSAAGSGPILATEALFVFAGGGLGSVARWGVGRLLPASGWPWATLLVNVVGSFALAWVAARWATGHPARTFLGIGVLGGFTTWSTFSYEVIQIWAGGRPAVAVGYAVVAVVGGLAAAALGWRMG